MFYFESTKNAPRLQPDIKIKKKKNAKVHMERKKPIAQKLTVPETEYILKWRLFYDKQIGDTTTNFTQRFLWRPEQHAVHPTLLLKRQGLIIFIIPSEIRFLARFEEVWWKSLHNKLFKRLVSERVWDKNFSDLSEPQIYPLFYMYIHVMLVKKSHGDKWLHTLVSLTMLKRYWSGERWRALES